MRWRSARVLSPKRAARGRLNLLDPVEIERIKGVTYPKIAVLLINLFGRLVAVLLLSKKHLHLSISRHPRDLLAKCAAQAPAEARERRVRVGGRSNGSGQCLPGGLSRVALGVFVDRSREVTPDGKSWLPAGAM